MGATDMNKEKYREFEKCFYHDQSEHLPAELQQNFSAKQSIPSSIACLQSKINVKTKKLDNPNSNRSCTFVTFILMLALTNRVQAVT